MDLSDASKRYGDTRSSDASHHSQTGTTTCLLLFGNNYLSITFCYYCSSFLFLNTFFAKTFLFEIVNANHMIHDSCKSCTEFNHFPCVVEPPEPAVVVREDCSRRHSVARGGSSRCEYLLV